MKDKTKKVIAGSLAALIAGGTPVSVASIKKYVDDKKQFENHISYYQSFAGYSSLDDVWQIELKQLEHPDLYKKIINNLEDDNATNIDLVYFGDHYDHSDFSLDYDSVRDIASKGKWNEKLTEEQIIFNMNRIYIINGKFNKIIMPTGIETKEEQNIYIRTLISYSSDIDYEDDLISKISKSNSYDYKYAARLCNLYLEINRLKHAIQWYENIFENEWGSNLQLTNARETLKKLSNYYFELASSIDENKKLSPNMKFMLYNAVSQQVPYLFCDKVLTEKQFKVLNKNNKKEKYYEETLELIKNNIILEIENAKGKSK